MTHAAEGNAGRLLGGDMRTADRDRVSSSLRECARCWSGVEQGSRGRAPGACGNGCSDRDSYAYREPVGGRVVLCARQPQALLVVCQDEKPVRSAASASALL